MVMSGYGKSGKYFTNGSSNLNLPLSLNWRIAADVKIFEVDANVNSVLSLLRVLFLKFANPNDFS
jgi:hypothetical protein